MHLIPVIGCFHACLHFCPRLFSSPGGDLQASSGNLDEEDCDDVDWEEEREMEKAACEGDDFIPPKIMVGGSCHDTGQQPPCDLLVTHSCLITDGLINKHVFYSSLFLNS